MEYQDKKPRRKREDRQEIGEQLLVGSIIGEIDRLEAIGKQAGRTAETYQQISTTSKGTSCRSIPMRSTPKKRVCGRI